MNDIDTAKRVFFEGLAYLENQNFGAAESSFIETLKLAPRSIPTLNNLATAQYKQNKIDEAAVTSKKAIEIDPENIDAYFMLANCQRQQKSHLEALATCEKLILINPALAEAHRNRGSVLSQLRKYEQALASFDRAISIQPQFLEAHLNRGGALRYLERYDEALAAYDKALTFKPELADAWSGRGKVCWDLAHYDEALTAYDKALMLQPDLADAWLGRGNVFADLQRYDDAFAAYDKALALKPDSAEAWNNYGTVLAELERSGDAFAAYDKALELEPDFADAWLARGAVFYDLRRYDEAIAAFDKAISLQPDFAKAWVSRGTVCFTLNRDDEALQCYQKAIDLKNNLADAYFAMSVLKLSRGEFKEGWALYEWRTRSKSIPIRERLSDAAIEALGVSVRNTRSQIIGKSIAVVAEQGVGDEIMFASMLPDVVNDAKSITYQLDPRLIRLAARSFPAVNFVPRARPNYILSQKFDAIIRAGSFGYIYRPDAASFPGKPYLKADASIVDRWRSALGRSGQAYRIGISWRGGAAKSGRDQRSLTLDQLRPLLTRDDCMFVSLQYGDVRDEVEKYNASAVRKIVHFPKAAIDDFDDLAGLIKALDIVVSVQNTVVHQCGALGTTCLAMLPWKAEWRYGKSGSQMIWYSSVELFRQSEKGNWGDVLAAVNSRLSAEMIKARECAQ